MFRNEPLGGGWSRWLVGAGWLGGLDRVVGGGLDGWWGGGLDQVVDGGWGLDPLVSTMKSEGSETWLSAESRLLP